MQGSAHLFSTLQADLTRHMQRFEQAALRDSLSMPPGLLHPSALPAALAAPCTPEDEQRADAQLAELRHKLKQVRCHCMLRAHRLASVRMLSAHSWTAPDIQVSSCWLLPPGSAALCSPECEQSGRCAASGAENRNPAIGIHLMKALLLLSNSHCSKGSSHISHRIWLRQAK